MRSLLCALVLAGCSPSGDPGGDPGPIDGPAAINCDDQSLVFVTPQPGQHYDPHFVLIVDMAEFYADHLPGAECLDDDGGGVAPTTAAAPAVLGNGMVEMQWTFDLQPGRRYSAWFSATECDRMVTFFTTATSLSPP